MVCLFLFLDTPASGSGLWIWLCSIVRRSAKSQELAYQFFSDFLREVK